MEKEKRGNVEYSGQVVDISRTDKRISVKDLLEAVTDQEDVPFLNVFSPKSIYYMSIFHFGMKQSTGANIPIRHLPEIREHTRLATKEIFQCANHLSGPAPVPGAMAEESAPASNAGTGMQQAAGNMAGAAPGTDSAAYRKLRMGRNLAGKSPAELLQYADDRNKMRNTLLTQVNYLNQNLAKYPNNRLDIEAIQDAVALLDQGMLAKADPAADPESEPAQDAQAEGESGNGKALKIYTPPAKYFKKIIDKDTGKTKCYKISIFCYPAREYPYQVRIKNYYAHLGKKGNGMTPILKSTAEKIVDYYIDLTESEWLYILEQMDQNLQACRELWYAYARKNDYSRRQIQEQYKYQPGYRQNP